MANGRTIMLRFQRGELIGRPRTPAALSAAAAWRPVRSSALCSSTTPAAASARSVVARTRSAGRRARRRAHYNAAFSKG